MATNPAGPTAGRRRPRANASRKLRKPAWPRIRLGRRRGHTRVSAGGKAGEGSGEGENGSGRAPAGRIAPFPPDRCRPLALRTGMRRIRRVPTDSAWILSGCAKVQPILRDPERLRAIVSDHEPFRRRSGGNRFFRRSGSLQEAPKALQALRRPSGRPKPRFPTDPPETGAVESPPTHERPLPRGRGVGGNPGSCAAERRSPRCPVLGSLSEKRRFSGDSPGRPPNTRAGASRAASPSALTRRTSGGFASSPVFPSNGPALLGAGPKDRWTGFPEWSNAR